ncbi:hypothetical protein HYPSUDRAFT_416596 [Hypholoma sublateritium FD-334 SS-4]|uniref:Uncharacterized protein n=1 Tax=Hypholoma sublateritium (strain FD-334 SS-4) TaxID=945553 RepID=A0A0D2P2L9_HYPSF|nr:hypothetical protein HYPSUDRAFT_416596 [Hypholoma sublateritium FD-334 SS-4]
MFRARMKTARPFLLHRCVVSDLVPQRSLRNIRWEDIVVDRTEVQRGGKEHRRPKRKLLPAYCCPPSAVHLRAVCVLLLHATCVGKERPQLRYRTRQSHRQQ